MNTLLIFFALPVATIILSIVLEKVLDCPLAVAAVSFAIYLIVTFAVFDETFLIATIVYTILSFLSALIARTIKNLINENNSSNNCLLTALENSNSNNNTNSNTCGCNCRRRF